jgi:hypothetical protein
MALLAAVDGLKKETNADAMSLLVIFLAHAFLVWLVHGQA